MSWSKTRICAPLISVLLVPTLVVVEAGVVVTPGVVPSISLLLPPYIPSWSVLLLLLLPEIQCCLSESRSIRISITPGVSRVGHWPPSLIIVVVARIVVHVVVVIRVPVISCTKDQN